MNNTELKNTWLKITSDCRGRESEWTEIEAAYSATGRHYHTLQHLCEVYEALETFYGPKIPAASLFALFYHDLIYSTLRTDNEKQSADYAFAKISNWHIAPEVAELVRNMIIATASHMSEDAETIIFLDADMAILGSEENKYQNYTSRVRQEFGIYPDLLYNRGRKKFVEGTLKREHIFLTAFFREKYEAQARINLANELKSLS